MVRMDRVKDRRSIHANCIEETVDRWDDSSAILTFLISTPFSK